MGRSGWVNDEQDGLVILTSQDKWDRMKAIIDRWLTALQNGEKELDFKSLQSDQGFLIYAV